MIKQRGLTTLQTPSRGHDRTTSKDFPTVGGFGFRFRV